MSSFNNETWRPVASRACIVTIGKCGSGGGAIDNYGTRRRLRLQRVGTRVLGRGRSSRYVASKCSDSNGESPTSDVGRIDLR